MKGAFRACDREPYVTQLDRCAHNTVKSTVFARNILCQSPCSLCLYVCNGLLGPAHPPHSQIFELNNQAKVSQKEANHYLEKHPIQEMVLPFQVLFLMIPINSLSHYWLIHVFFSILTEVFN